MLQPAGSGMLFITTHNCHPQHLGDCDLHLLFYYYSVRTNNNN